MTEIEKLREMVKVQCTDGNWNYSEYMHGLANGMICALAIVTDEDPKYLSAPEEWLCDKESDLTCVVTADSAGVPNSTQE